MEYETQSDKKLLEIENKTEVDSMDIEMNTNNKEISKVKENIESKEIKSDEENRKELKNKLTLFFEEHVVYETLPENSKILIFTKNTLLIDAVKLMIKEEIYSGILWDEVEHKCIYLLGLNNILQLFIEGFYNLINFIGNNENINSYENLMNNLKNFFTQFNPKANTYINNDKIKMDIEFENNDNDNGNKIINDKKEVFEKIISNFSILFKIVDSITLNDYFYKIQQYDSQSFYIMNIDESINNCINLFVQNNKTFFLCEDLKTNNIAGFVSYDSILNFIINNYYSQMNEFKTPLNHFFNNIDCNIFKLYKNDSLLTSFEMFYKNNIKMILIYNNENEQELFAYFFARDIMYIFAEGRKFNYYTTIGDFITDLYKEVDSELPYGKFRLCEIYNNINIKETLEIINNSYEKLIIIRDKNNSILNIISVDNIFKSILFS